MALWKPFRGNRAGLDKVEKHDGYVYFCIDDGSLFFDYTDADGNLHRKQINAKDAETLLGHSIEEFLIASENGSFAHGEGSAATGNNSYAGGYKTLAGGKGFKITGFEDNGNGTGKYTLSSVTGLETEMRYSAVLSSANYNAGKIIEIVGNVVTVDGYKDIEFNSNADNADEFNVYNFLTIVDRPDLGDREVGFNAHTEGENTIASNKATHAEGRNTKAIGKFAHAEGSNTIAGHGAHAEGSGSQALGDISHAEGNRTKATGNYSHTEGNNTVASAQGTHAEGIKAQAIYNAAHAEGQNTLANGLAAHAEGESTIAKFTGSHAEGVSTQAIEEAAHAEGYNTQATAKAAHAEGENTVASAKRAHAEGYSTSASELNAHAEGKLTTASAEEAHAEGISTIASGAYSHTEGNTTQALSEAAHAEGKETIAQGIGAHAEGSKSRALNNAAHAEGSNTEASGAKSHSEGNSTKATGTASHAEGDKTEAKGYASHAGGQNSIASNAGSFVHGTGLKTNSNNQFVVGAYNKTFNEAGAAAFIVGNGKEDARSNALAVMKSGDAYLKGDLYVGGLPEGDEGTGIAKVATEDEAHSYTDAAVKNKADKHNTVITGSLSMGRDSSSTIGAESFAMGSGTVASGKFSYAGGYGTQATGRGAHAEGNDTHAWAEYAHAEGSGNFAKGLASHTEGIATVAEGAASHAGGRSTKTTADHAFAHGNNLLASAENQFVVGQYNKEDPDALFIVGGGDSEENRKNLFAVKKDGSIVGLNTSNALTKTVSGEAISATDVSPIEHEMDVQVRGKNLLNLNNPYVTSGGEMTIDGTAITLTKKATGNPPSIIFELGAYKDFVGKTLTISFVLDAMGSSGGTNGNAAMAIHCGNTAKEAVESVNGISYSNGRVGETITKTFTVPVLDDKGRQLCIRHYMSNGKTEGDYITISNFQIEEGTVATAYVPYIEDISTVKVKKYGKNLLNRNAAEVRSGTLSFDGNRQTFTSANGGGDLFYEIGDYKDFVGKTITVSYIFADLQGKFTSFYTFIQADGVELKKTDKYDSTTKQFKLTYTIPENATAEKLRIRQYVGYMFEKAGDYIILENLQVEIGDAVTEWEEYKESIEYPVSADGIVEGVTSLYPATTLIPDTAGAVMDCTYNRDINRVLDDTGFMYDHNPSGTGSFSMNRKVGSEIGEYSHTEGYSSAAIGKASHAGGEATQAKSVGSFAHGQRVTADADYQATFGTHNEVNTNAAFIVGNGSSSAKSNAFEVQKDGNAFVQGNIYVYGAGSTQAAAQPVATQAIVDAIDRRIEKVENIISSGSGDFIEDSSIAYIKEVPSYVAPYASLNKVGGMGIRKNNHANLFTMQGMPSNIVDGYYTLSYNDGVITINDAAPVEEWTSEPFFSSSISMGTISLPAGEYTVSINYPDSFAAPPYGLLINGIPNIVPPPYVGGYHTAFESNSNPYTFTLEETTELQFDFVFDCGGSIYCPVGEPTDYQYKIMLNKGAAALPWQSPLSSVEGASYIEPAKVTSVDVVGKNVFDYGTPRALGGEFYDSFPSYWYQARVLGNGGLYLETLSFSEGEVGPGSDYGSMFALELEGINTSKVYPAGVYSISSSVTCGDGNQDRMYLTLSIKLLESNTTRVNLTGHNITIAEPFIITHANLVYEPATLSSYISGVTIPLTLVKGASPLNEFIPYACTTIRIPESITSRADYGLGLATSRVVFSNYIDFDTKEFVKKCLSMELTSTETEFFSHNTNISIDTVEGTYQCSDSSLVCEFSRYGPEWGCFRAYFEYPGDAEEYIADARANGTPIQVFFGTSFEEKIDISAELAGIDNYIPVEAGGLIYFNNEQQVAVPNTIEYQSMMKKGEIEEL